jgi:mannose-6-phosphate isomerase
MIRLQPFVTEKIWGYENWIVSTHPAGESRGENAIGYARPLKKILGKEYPLLITVIQANETLSVQVHPGDEYARVHEDASGKTECWLVLNAAPGARLVTGLKAGTTKDDVRTAIQQNSFERYLYYETVSQGDFIYIPAGHIHAIGGGIRLLEVQQSSDITYRLYDWGRPRELHIEKALDVLDTSETLVTHNFLGKFSSPYFSLERIAVNNQAQTFVCEPDTVLFILSGNGRIAQNGAPLKAEDTFFFSERESVTVEGALDVIKIQTQKNPQVM